jgi:TetR/AcrR family transcriptional regulator, mexJK operon transcriptional repressor
MPRVAGQIDVAKNEAILDAAVAAMGERGLAVSLEEVARRAGVSKQTIYNHYGSKAELLRALMARRVDAITAPLEMPGAADHPQQALAGFARTMMSALLDPNAIAFMRVIVLSAAELPELAETFYSAGRQNSRARLAQFLARETAAGRLDTPDPALAADFFSGMVVGTYQFALTLGLNPNLTAKDIDRIADEAAGRFLRAFAP